MPPISVMLKPSSSLCNLRCEYCFCNSLAGQRESFSHGMMSPGTAEHVISLACEYSGGADIHFAFQGGEPLLSGLPFFEFFVMTANSYNRYNSRIFYSIQTNGTLVDRKWCAFLKKNC